MRKLVLYMLMSLDGGVDHPGQYFPHPDPDHSGPPFFDDRMVELETEMIGRQDAVLLGRNTYDQWSWYWPTSDEQPFADFINGARKYVVTSRPLGDQPWGPVEVVDGPLADALAALRDQPGGDIGVHGSVELARSLLRDNLVDELCLIVGPVLDATGRRLFDQVTDVRRLQLVSSTATPSGALWLVYRPVDQGAGQPST